MREIHLIDDDRLPEGHTWALCRIGDDFHLFIKKSAAHPKALEAAWAAYDRLRERESPTHGTATVGDCQDPVRTSAPLEAEAV
jgi:hypothetical protein